jgi:hypothetical protein
MKNQSIVKFALTLVVAMSLASCGSDNKSGGGSASLSPSGAQESIVSGQHVFGAEGTVKQATSQENFRQLIAAGNFARVQNNTECGNFYKPHTEYIFAAQECEKHSWYTTCSGTDFKAVTENVATGAISNTNYGATKTEIINRLLSDFDSADAKQFNPNGYEVILTKGSVQSVINFNYPIAAQPVKITTQVSGDITTVDMYNNTTNFTCK